MADSARIVSLNPIVVAITGDGIFGTYEVLLKSDADIHNRLLDRLPRWLRNNDVVKSALCLRVKIWCALFVIRANSRITESLRKTRERLARRDNNIPVPPSLSRKDSISERCAAAMAVTIVGAIEQKSGLPPLGWSSRFTPSINGYVYCAGLLRSLYQIPIIRDSVVDHELVHVLQMCCRPRPEGDYLSAPVSGRINGALDELHAGFFGCPLVLSLYIAAFYFLVGYPIYRIATYSYLLVGLIIVATTLLFAASRFVVAKRRAS